MILNLLVLWACTPGGDTEGTDTDTGFGPDQILERTMEVAGVQRDYLLVVPASAKRAMPEVGLPTLVVVHDNDDTPSSILMNTGIQEMASTNGVLVVLPSAFQGGWPSGSWPGEDGQPSSQANDLAFLQGVVADVGQDWPIDTSRAFATGHGYGATMLLFLTLGTGYYEVYGSPISSPYGAYGVCGAFDPFMGSPGPSEPKRATWVIHGTEDAEIPYEQGEALAATLDYYGFETRFTAVDGAGHVWLWQDELGNSNQDLWSWLETHGGE